MLKTLTKPELKTLLIAVLVAISGYLGIDIHLASMPHIMHFMHTDKQHMHQSVSLFLLGIGSSLLVYGPLSDKYGRKPVMLTGLSIAVLASLSSVFTTHITPFLITRLLQGVGAGACIGLARTIVSDILHGNRFATIGSYFSMLAALSPLLAPAAGGYIQSWFGWQANFIALACILLVALILYALLCPETNEHKNKALSTKALFNNYKTLLAHPLFLGFTALSGLATAVNMVYATTSSFILQGHFHVSPVAYGWLTAVVGLGSMSGKFFLPPAIKRYTRLGSLLIGLLLLTLIGLVLTGLVLLHMINIPALMIAVYITLFSQAFIMISAGTSALSIFQDKKGAANAIYGAFQMLLAFIVSAGVGALSHDGVLLLSGSYLGLGLIGLLVYFSVIKGARRDL